MRYELVPAQPSDEEWLEKLRRDVYAELFQATWGGWDEARHCRHFAACIERGGIRIIVIGGERVGMIQVFEGPDAVELGEVQVGRRHQNRGIGSAVLEDVLSRAHANEKAVRLRVGLKNDGARRLYERLGFRCVARTETHDHMVYEP